jgi:DNA mismatch endonuclease, patch repair protein
MVDIVNTSTRSRIMASIRGTNTKPEMVLRRLLHASGLRYRLHARNLPGKPDIVFPRRKAVVFVHGCFWHRHSGCHWCTTPAANSGFWSKKFAENVKRDQRCVEELLELDWRVGTVWECALRGEEAPRTSILLQNWLGSNSLQFETDLIRPQASMPSDSTP